MTSREQSGFSLIEIMIAATLVGAIGMSVMGLVNNAFKAQKNIDVSMAESELFNQVRINLVDKTACEQSFSGLNISSSITNIKRRDATTLLTTGNNYANGALKVNSMNLSRVSGSNGSIGIARLSISFQRLQGKIGSFATKTLDFSTDTSATGNITTCFADVDNAINTACQQIGGSLTTGYCNLATFTSTTTPALTSTSAASILYVQNFIDSTYVKNKYVDAAGDTMTGLLSLMSNGLNVGAGQLLVSGGNVSTTGNISSSGNISSDGTISTTGKISTIATTDDSIATSGGMTARKFVLSVDDSTAVVNDLTAASKKYVYQMLTANLSIAQKQAIVSSILNNMPTNDYTSLRNSIIDYIDNSNLSCSGSSVLQTITCDSSGTCSKTCYTPPSTTISVSSSCDCSSVGGVVEKISISGNIINCNCQQWLYQTVHTLTQCQNIGGSLDTQFGVNACRLSGGCPGGWTPLRQRYNARTCQETNQFSLDWWDKNSGMCTGTGSNDCCFYADQEGGAAALPIKYQSFNPCTTSTGWVSNSSQASCQYPYNCGVFNPGSTDSSYSKYAVPIPNGTNGTAPCLAWINSYCFNSCSPTSVIESVCY